MTASKITPRPKMSRRQSAWLGRQKRQGHQVATPVVLADGRMTVMVRHGSGQPWHRWNRYTIER